MAEQTETTFDYIGLLDSLVVPLTLALLGLIGVAIGSWLSGRSSLRLRLMDIYDRQDQASREFGIRAIRAINEVGLTLTHAVDERKEQMLSAMSEADGESVQVTLQTNPRLQERIEASTEEWRTILAMSHYFSAGDLAQTIQSADMQRATIIDLFKTASTVDLIEIVRKECNDFLSHHVRQVYRQLQVEKLNGTLRLYDIARMVRLRHFTKDVYNAFIEQRAMGLELYNKNKRGSEISNKRE